MTPEQETELAYQIIGARTSALVIPDAHMGRSWVPGQKTAADLAWGNGLLPLTVAEARIAANLAAVLGGYCDCQAPEPGAWR